MNITSNGTYTLTPINHRFSSGTVYVSGALGACTAIINVDIDGTLTPLTSGTITTDEQYKIDHGHMSKLVLVVTASDGSTDFDIDYNGMT